MDNALCGGAGATLTGNALASVKAAIFMGDPHNTNGLPYNVGTCQAGGVSKSMSNTDPNFILRLFDASCGILIAFDHLSSLPLVLLDSNARLRALPSFNPTATLPTRTAATAMTPTPISSMSISTASRH